MNSFDVLDKILKVNPNIVTLRLFSFLNATKLQDRITYVDELDRAIIERALAKKEKEKIRFWDAILTIFSESGEFSERLLSEVFYHQPNRKYSYVGRSQLKIFLNDHREDLMALNSKVILADGKKRHIPLLDFKVASKPNNNNLVLACIRALGLRGYLLNSGKSYHFIGVELVTEKALLEILAKFVLLHPISDKAWAAHQIIEKSASLRVTNKRGVLPTLVARIE